MTVIEMALYKHQMEIKLKERQGWLTTILQSIGEGVIATDRFGNITFMNPVAEKLTGWNQPESIGKSLTSVLHLVDEDTGKLVRLGIPESCSRTAPPTRSTATSRSSTMSRRLPSS